MARTSRVSTLVRHARRIAFALACAVVFAAAALVVAVVVVVSSAHAPATRHHGPARAPTATTVTTLSVVDANAPDGPISDPGSVGDFSTSGGNPLECLPFSCPSP